MVGVKKLLVFLGFVLGMIYFWFSHRQYEGIHLNVEQAQSVRTENRRPIFICKVTRAPNFNVECLPLETQLPALLDLG